MSDRRSKERIALPVDGRMDLGGKVVPCVILNLSEGGLAVRIDAKLEPASPVRVSFRLGRHDAAEASIDAEFVNRRGQGADGTAVWGLRMLPMDPGTRIRIRDLVLVESRKAS
jgi:hypothetical protein